MPKTSKDKNAPLYAPGELKVNFHSLPHTTTIRWRSSEEGALFIQNGDEISFCIALKLFYRWMWEISDE